MFLHKRVVLRFAAYDISNLNRRIFLEKEQGNIYRVHLLFPNVKYLKFPFESVTPKAVSSYRIKAYFLFPPPYEKDRLRGFPRRIFHLPNLKMGINKRNSQNK